jgi:hypothetical protein
MTANVLRDAQVLPALHSILEGGLLCYLDQARHVLTEPLGARGRRRERVDAAARAAIDLHTGRALAPLGDTEAAELAAGLIELAADTDSTRQLGRVAMAGQPVVDGGDLDDGFVADGAFVVSGGDGAVAFESVDAALDIVSLLVVHRTEHPSISMVGPAPCPQEAAVPAAATGRETGQPASSPRGWPRGLR